MKALVSLVSIATCAVSGWMCVMYVVLRHPGYQVRAALAALVCLGAATLVAGRPPAPLRIPMTLWGAAIAAFGVWALRSPGDDGWVLVAGTLFIVEGALAVTSSVRRPA
jgi:hypothetical protein